MSKLQKDKDFKLIYLDDDYVRIQGNCRITGEEYRTKSFPLIDWINHRNSNKPIQQMLPYLSDNDREFIISGTTPKGWDVMFEQQQDLKLKW
ncbi:MAG: hypothetical protein CMD20_01225 [Flavobacteriales bacterium]|jgi:hypothetical protein|nr:hypothetical protein [Flavobacteriales bacterium]|tara:strand:+ start:599 stop:874 length:276 start_codon:yes stop_codon:yes gene_type:complete